MARLWLTVVHPWGAEEAAPLAGSADDRALRRCEADYLRGLQDRLAEAFGIEPARRVLEGDRAPALLSSEVTMRRPRAAESASIDREHLTRILLEQMERAYGSEGIVGLSRMLGELLRRLDDRALRDYALALGLASELELEDETDRDRPHHGGPG